MKLVDHQLLARTLESSSATQEVSRTKEEKEIKEAPLPEVEKPQENHPAKSHPGILAGMKQKAVAAVLIAVSGLGMAAPAYGGPLTTEGQASNPTSQQTTKRTAHKRPATKRQTTKRATKARTDQPSKTRAPLTLTLTNDPRLDAGAHSDLYAAGPAALGIATEQFALRYPEYNRHFAARFVEFALSVGLEVPWMVLSHEYGHYRVASANGWDPEVEMTGWASGLTRYNIPDGDEDPGHLKRITASAGGVNQEELNADQMFTRWARNGDVRYQEAMAYMLAQTNLALYATRTSTLSDPPGSDDIESYTRLLGERGHKLSSGQLAGMAIAADLLSAPFWASLKGQVEFLVKGDRRVEMPMFPLGDREATFPNFHVLLTGEGPVIGGQMIVDPRGEIPVQLTVDVRFDRSAFAAGVKAFDVPIGDHLRLNPFLRYTYDKNTGSGGLIGTDLTCQLNDYASITGSVSYQANDLLGEPNGRSDGIDVRLQLGIHY